MASLDQDPESYAKVLAVLCKDFDSAPVVLWGTLQRVLLSHGLVNILAPGELLAREDPVPKDGPQFNDENSEIEEVDPETPEEKKQKKEKEKKKHQKEKSKEKTKKVSLKKSARKTTVATLPIVKNVLIQYILKNFAWNKMSSGPLCKDPKASMFSACLSVTVTFRPLCTVQVKRKNQLKW